MDMCSILRLRFDALAGYWRYPHSAGFGEEVGWFKYGDASALGLLLIERQDRDYGGLVLRRDRKRRFLLRGIIYNVQRRAAPE